MVDVLENVTNETRYDLLSQVADRLRYGSLKSTSVAGSGHPTSCMSCAEIMAALFFDQMRIDVDQMDNLHNDRLILSKGHAAPILWSAFYEAGLLSENELEGLRQIDSEQEGHPTPRNPWVDVATGSLGQGLSMGLGMAWNARKHGTESHTYVLLGDGEIAEGSIWEAAGQASHMELTNITAIVDVNCYGQTGETMHGRDIDEYMRRFEAFGWRTSAVDGHDIEEVTMALEEARKDDENLHVILANTVKGKGVDSLEGNKGKHGKPTKSLDESVAQLDDKALRDGQSLKMRPPRVTGEAGPQVPPKFRLPKADYRKDGDIAPREAFGKALIDLGKMCDELVTLDGDVCNSTKTQSFFEQYPERAIQCYIAEQNMMGMAVGLSRTGMLPCVSTFAAFLTRAFDQLRIAAISRARMVVAGSHCGVAIGHDGPTQMGLEDIAMFRCLPNSRVFYPSDAPSTHAALQEAASHDGISYVRLTRNSLPTIYGPETDFETGRAQVWSESPKDKVTLIGAGVTFHECVKAHQKLEAAGIPTRVIDCFSVKPIDEAVIRRCASETDAIVVVEDHYAAGGMGEAVKSALGDTPVRVRHMCIESLPRSGSPEALMKHHGISSQSIIETAQSLVT